MNFEWKTEWFIAGYDYYITFIEVLEETYINFVMRPLNTL